MGLPPPFIASRACWQAISRKSEVASNVGTLSAEKLNEMKSDLDFKQMQMDNSVNTSGRLAQELERRRVELDKINTLDQKISLELTQLEEKMSNMTTELVTFSDIKKLKDEANSRREGMVAAKATADKRSAASKTQGADLKAQHDQIKANLGSDDVAASIEELEGKMRHHEQTVYVLSEYIEVKGAESNYEPIADDCMMALNQVNQETQRVLAEAPVFMPAMGF